MKKFLFSLIVAICLCITIVPGNTKEIGGVDVGFNLDFTYASKYMWHGYDTFGGHGGLMPSAKVSAYGFTLGAWSAFPDSSGYDRLTEVDYFLSYAHTFFEKEKYALATSLGYTYLSYPKVRNTVVPDTSEMAFSIGLPNLLTIGPANLVPSYTGYYEFDGIDSTIDDGFFHTFALAYSLPVPAFLPEQESQTIDFTYDITYGDGPFGAIPNWSYTTLGVATTFKYKSAYFTPGVYYQWSLDDSAKAVNRDDDFYAKFSIGYNF